MHNDLFSSDQKKVKTEPQKNVETDHHNKECNCAFGDEAFSAYFISHKYQNIAR
jgi:hypothetical protein